MRKCTKKMRVDMLGKVMMMHRPGRVGPVFRVVVGVMRVIRVRDRRGVMLGVPGIRMVVWNDMADVHSEQDHREIQPVGACSFPP